MNGHGGYKQQHPPGPGRGTTLQSGKALHPGSQALQQQQKRRTGQYPGGGDGKGPGAAARQRRQDQTCYGGAEHHSGRKRHDGLASGPIGGTAEAIAAQRAQHGGAAHGQGREKNQGKHEERTPSYHMKWCAIFMVCPQGGAGADAPAPAGVSKKPQSGKIMLYKLDFLWYPI